MHHSSLLLRPNHSASSESIIILPNPHVLSSFLFLLLFSKLIFLLDLTEFSLRLVILPLLSRPHTSLFFFVMPHPPALFFCFIYQQNLPLLSSLVFPNSYHPSTVSLLILLLHFLDSFSYLIILSHRPSSWSCKNLLPHNHSASNCLILLLDFRCFNLIFISLSTFISYYLTNINFHLVLSITWFLFLIIFNLPFSFDSAAS